MSLLLDAAALVAIDRNERAMWVRLKAALVSGAPPVTHAGVVGQVWRGGPRQARLAQALAGIDIVPLDDDLARAAGRLLGASGLYDVIDAAVVAMASDGDDIVTSDHDDLRRLVHAAGVHVELIHP